MSFSGYAYHAFISYPRRLYAEGDDGTEHACGEWLRMLFIDFFKSCLSDELPESARVFLDVDEIPTGASWPQVLASSLSTSCCLIPVWSASYFRSRHCLWEWESFRKRGEGLVVPIGWTKPKAFFPEAALETNFHDFSRYAYPNPAYLRTEEGVGLQRAIRDFAIEVAKAISLAPQFSEQDTRFLPSELPPPPPKKKLPFVRLGAAVAEVARVHA